MATLAELATQVAAKVETLSSSPARLASDQRIDLEKIPAGAARYQVRAWPPAIDEGSDSNVAYTAAEVHVAIHYRLGTAEAERDYSEGDHLVDAEAMLARDWWADLAAVFDVTQGPATESPIARVGNVLSFTIAAELRVQP